MSDFHFLNSVQNKINNKFIELLKTNPASCPRLQQALEYTLLNTGKRLRPALVYASSDFSSFINNTQNNNLTNHLLLNTACAIELIHTYSLVHDDLPAMDNDDIRRGKPSCHIQFDEATAILTGDCLQTMAFDLLSTEYIVHNNLNILKNQLKIIKLLSQASGYQGMVAGQSIELNQDSYKKNNLNITPLELLDTVHLLKTGKLITVSLQIGGILTNCTPEQYDLLTALGNKLGLIYQIKDDILDYLPNTKQLPCYPGVLGLEQAHAVLNLNATECAELISQLRAENSQLDYLVTTIITRGS
jgi:geranylgeranyl pyrophosphate synthase